MGARCWSCLGATPLVGPGCVEPPQKYSPAIGVKLIATPWTDANLQHVEGITAEELRQEHRAKGVPESFVEVLHLAALADVRMLVFDADAPVLDGLTLYDDE